MPWNAVKVDSLQAISCGAFSPVLCNIRMFLQNCRTSIEKIMSVESLFPDSILKWLYSFQKGLQKSALEIKIINTSTHSNSSGPWSDLLFPKVTRPRQIFIWCADFTAGSEWANVRRGSKKQELQTLAGKTLEELWLETLLKGSSRTWVLFYQASSVSLWIGTVVFWLGEVFGALIYTVFISSSKP